MQAYQEHTRMFAQVAGSGLPCIQRASGLMKLLHTVQITLSLLQIVQQQQPPIAMQTRDCGSV